MTQEVNPSTEDISTLDITQLTDITLGNANFEYIFLSLKISTYKISLAILYRPPITRLGDMLDALNDIIPQLLTKYDYSVLMGDWNVNMLQHNSLLETFDTYDYFNLINEPTRITATSATCLDPIFINCKEICLNSGTVPSDVSDHNRMPFCTLNIVVRNLSRNLFSIQRLQTAQCTCLEQNLLNIPWDNIFILTT
ncbi:hypothetical protein JTB14_003020 [Gonioctena quinquepunctata]|nr:hypothetical protein JTB14_003020 [Gonioctena quinquepunctata]